MRKGDLVYIPQGTYLTWKDKKIQYDKAKYPLLPIFYSEVSYEPTTGMLIDKYDRSSWEVFCFKKRSLYIIKEMSFYKIEPEKEKVC